MVLLCFHISKVILHTVLGSLNLGKASPKYYPAFQPWEENFLCTHHEQDIPVLGLPRCLPSGTFHYSTSSLSVVCGDELVLALKSCGAHLSPTLCSVTSHWQFQMVTVRVFIPQKKWQMLQMRALFFIISFWEPFIKYLPAHHWPTLALKPSSEYIWGNHYPNILFDIIVLVGLQDQEILCTMAFSTLINKKPIRFLPVTSEQVLLLVIARSRC